MIIVRARGRRRFRRLSEWMSDADTGHAIESNLMCLMLIFVEYLRMGSASRIEMIQINRMVLCGNRGIVLEFAFKSD